MTAALPDVAEATPSIIVSRTSSIGMSLDEVRDAVEVLTPGLQTTVQDVDGRHGLWGVGVPPSGAFDAVSFALATRAVGNEPYAAGLECVVTGPTLRFADRRCVCVTGAATHATLDGRPLPPGRVAVTSPGSVLEVGSLGEDGQRGYIAISGGIDVAQDLGSRSTFLLGGFGGHHGRALEPRDILPLGHDTNGSSPLDVDIALPELGHTWALRVVLGPHGAPDLLTDQGLKSLLETPWRIALQSDRTGIRLEGPKPEFARTDGGEAGMHPSNIHDSAYPVGGIMLSGDVPVIVGPDGPSLGGFVVPACVVAADLWKLGQMRAGDVAHLVPVSPEQAAELDDAQRERLDGLSDHMSAAHLSRLRDGGHTTADPACVLTASARAPMLRPEPVFDQVVDSLGERVTIRHAGDRHLLLEAGAGELDLRVRMWIHLLHQQLEALPTGPITEIVPGVRSVLVGVDTRPRDGAAAAVREAAALVVDAVNAVDDPDGVEIECREVTLPIAFDDPRAHEAMRRYDRVNPQAPWSPDNVEFIRRVNDLPSRNSVFEVVQEASYLVLGLGDVYLGAPVAVPIDPRHRLVTTKYNPARTWTPENAVGIGGVYLCVYGMEGPGGYQLVGRTVPVWRHTRDGSTPWLLRHFDRLRFRPVTSQELDEDRRAIRAGEKNLEVRPARFSLAELADIEAHHQDEIRTTVARRKAAFDEEVARWAR